MYSVAVFLSRRKPETVKVYKRSLTRFADHVGFTLDNLHEYLVVPKEKLTGDLITFADTLKSMGQNSQRNTVASVMSYLKNMKGSKNKRVILMCQSIVKPN